MKTKLSDRVDEAKRLYSVRDTAERYTGRPVPPSRRIVCPFPHHVHGPQPTPSLMVYDNYFKCHGTCGASGDVINFIGYLKYGANYRKTDPKQTDEILTELRCAVVQRIPEIQLPEQRPTIPMRLVESQHTALKESRLAQDYLAYRGLEGLEDEFQLGYRTRRTKHGIGHYLAIPAFEFGSVIGIKYRRIDTAYQTPTERDHYLRFDSEPGSRLGTFNLDRALYATGLVVVVEAEITAMRLHQLGVTAIAPTNGARSIDHKLKDWLALANVVIIGDNDDNRTGVLGAEKRKSIIGHGTIVYPPSEFGDLDDFLTAGGQLDEILYERQQQN